MTQAICFNCGEIKFGSFTECGKCGFTPVSDDDEVVSFLLTDHFYNIDELKTLSNRIKNGAEIEVSEEKKQQVISDIKEVRDRLERNFKDSRP